MGRRMTVQAKPVHRFGNATHTACGIATRADRGVRVAGVGAKVTCKRCNGLCGTNPRVGRLYAVRGYGYPMLCIEDNMGAVLLKPACKNEEGQWVPYSNFDLTLYGSDFVTQTKLYEEPSNGR